MEQQELPAEILALFERPAGSPRTPEYLGLSILRDGQGTTRVMTTRLDPFTHRVIPCLVDRYDQPPGEEIPIVQVLQYWAVQLVLDSGRRPV